MNHELLIICVEIIRCVNIATESVEAHLKMQHLLISNMKAFHTSTGVCHQATV